MPENFTKLNIGSPKDLDFVFATLASHGRGISQDKLAERRERSGEVARRIEGGLDQVSSILLLDRSASRN